MLDVAAARSSSEPSADMAGIGCVGRRGRRALALMRAIKHQLDPKGTLNPGRFAGGI